MKFKITILLTFLLSFGALGKSPKMVEAYFDYKSFYAPGAGHYVETYLHFNTLSLVYKMENGEEKASVEIIQIIKDLDSNIVDFKKYKIHSPVVKDSIREDFSDVQRFILEPGNYEIELSIRDLNNPSGQPISTIQPLKVNNYSNKVAISDIELLENAIPTEEKTEYTKVGYTLFPHILNYYPEEFTKIALYFEIYNTHLIDSEAEYFAYKLYLMDRDNQEIIPNTVKIKRKKAGEITPVLTRIPIDNLPSGNYDLVVEVLDQEQKVWHDQSVFLQRSNPKLDVSNMNLEDVLVDKKFVQDVDSDSLPYYVESMVHITSYADKQTIYALLDDGDEEMLRKFFQKFWVKTNPNNPDEAWYNYKKQVLYTERVFGTQSLYGFRTERGRVYLKYGEPNSIIDIPNEPSSYPYQIWHYYKIGRFSNKKFIFYQPNLATNEYVVLHSNLQGERSNYRWQHELNKRNSAFSDIDDPNDGNTEHWGGNSGIYYRNPY